MFNLNNKQRGIVKQRQIEANLNYIKEVCGAVRAELTVAAFTGNLASVACHGE